MTRAIGFKHDDADSHVRLWCKVTEYSAEQHNAHVIAWINAAFDELEAWISKG